jgi:predicted CxxxxCH...CXXCH cytochrome family protein
MRSTILVASALATSIVAATLPLGCDVEARPIADEPTYRDDVATILDARCARCHAGDAPAAGFRANSYAGAIGCTTKGAVAVLPADAAPLLLALARPDHREFATDEERATLARWVASGAQSVRAGVHPRAFADPRSPSGHATVLRATRYRALTDRNDRDACAQCHEGAGVRPAKITSSAAGATACTTCHADSGGVNACATCHGAPGRPYPPRDTCFYPSDSKNDAHAAHAAPSRSSAQGLDCASCHPRPALGSFTGAHADGYVEVWFDHAVAGRDARFDGVARRCTGTCHDRGGATPAPTWTSGGAALDCNSCHSSPPKAHFTGPCSSCHREANASGTALAAPHLHVNGNVDLGDGSGRCGACHGSGDSPWPSTGAHAAHASPAGAAAVACETCHSVPGPNDAHPLRAGAAVVRLAGLATKGGRPATYDPATKTCAATYCHEGAGAGSKAPRWTDGASARACGSCHATPPPPPHAQDTSCGASTCHEGVTTSALALSAAGRAVHVNGIIDRRVP